MFVVRFWVMGIDSKKDVRRYEFSIFSKYIDFIIT